MRRIVPAVVVLAGVAWAHAAHSAESALATTELAQAQSPSQAEFDQLSEAVGALQAADRNRVLNRQERLARIDSLTNTIETLENQMMLGELDVDDSLRQAQDVLALNADEAQEHRSGLEAERSRRAWQAVADSRSALVRNDLWQARQSLNDALYLLAEMRETALASG
jgi:hypothetical protein